MDKTGYSKIKIWEDTRRSYYDHEPSVPIHNVFSRAIPGAFGIEFFRKLIAASPQSKNETCKNAEAVHRGDQNL